MTRMIERWFPCQEVTESSGAGWGSSNSEIRLFPWFAKRPRAQARAATLTSLLEWPSGSAEQEDLQKQVRAALEGHDAVPPDLRTLLAGNAKVLDPFSGRGLLPLEAVYLGAGAFGLDYSPVACMASRLLIDYPHRDWSQEPSLPFDGYFNNPTAIRLVQDVEAVLDHVGEAVASALDSVYPTVGGVRPWAYMWAVSIPCQECDLRFPLLASVELRRPNPKAGDPGQSLYLSADTGELVIEVRSGAPTSSPTLVLPPGQSKHSSKGKLAVCPRCAFPHQKDVASRVAATDGEDLLVAVCEADRVFRSTCDEDREGVRRGLDRLRSLPLTPSGLSAVPDEKIPPQYGWTIQGQAYGVEYYRDLSVPRQNLLFAATSRAIRDCGQILASSGLSNDYVVCLVEYAASVMCRRLKFSTRGAHLRLTGGAISDVFGNTESSWSYNYDSLETGIAKGPGEWSSLSANTVSTLRKLCEGCNGDAGTVVQGSALHLPFPDDYFDAVITDPPYDEMIDYQDASDLYFAWLKRATDGVTLDFIASADHTGLQNKAEELIVKKGKPAGDHRTRAHYDSGLTTAFAEAHRVLKQDGVLTIVFGHGEPEVWHRLLTSIVDAGLVLTGSWPARTEKRTGGSNIETTLTLACRAAAPDRPSGRVSEVDAEVRQEVRERVPLWDAAGLALTDQLMASAGPALEVVGRYSEVLDKGGNPVDLDRYLPLARRFVEEAADIRIDTLPLETFDARTRFALFWARLYGRGMAAASEARWHRLASDLSEDDTAGLLGKQDKGVRLAYSREVAVEPSVEGPVIDAAFAVAAAGKSVAEVADILLRTGRTEDPFVWAAMGELARVVPEADPDGDVWTWVVRNRSAITGASRNVEAARVREEQQAEASGMQTSLFGEGD